MECAKCDIHESDLPDGIDVGEFFSEMYGQMYCIGCVEEYVSGNWRLWAMPDYEGCEIIFYPDTGEKRKRSAEILRNVENKFADGGEIDN